MNNTTFKINNKLIRATYDRQGKIRISLDDLCGILKREDLIRNSEAIRLCQSSLRIQFRVNGKELWTIKPVDVHKIVNIAQKETTLPRQFLRKLETWANDLIENENPVIRKSEPVVLHYEEDFPVTFQNIDGKVMINTTQITSKFGKIPSEWLRITSTDLMRREMAESGQTGSYDGQIYTTRGRGKGATWLVAPLAIQLIRWLSPQNNLTDWCLEQLEKMSDLKLIIPSSKPILQNKQPIHFVIQKNLPDNLPDAHSLIIQLHTFIRENLPKIEFYQEFIENRDWFKSTRVADELKISPHQLHQFLMEEGICKYENKCWAVFRAYRAWQCDISYTSMNRNTGKTYFFGAAKRWTQEGRESIIELWYQKHVQAQI